MAYNEESYLLLSGIQHSRCPSPHGEGGLKFNIKINHSIESRMIGDERFVKDHPW